MSIKYAIVDIETTGANKKGNKITEIGIIITDGVDILEQFSSLINPERSIPTHITYLTRITNAMVQDKPKFYELAKQIVEITKDCIFVAHNVFFDYNFLRSEFQELGFNFQRKKLCTVRMARKAFPGLQSYSLGNLTQHFSITHQQHHRALDDAKAAYELFKLIIKEQPDLPTRQLESSGQRLTSLPPHLKIDDLEAIPENTGIYHFYDEAGELLYIGKSKNLKKRIQNHFRPNIKRKKDLQLKYKIHRIETKILGNELAALLIESQEIKNHKPEFNIALKASSFKYQVILCQKAIPYLKITSQKNLDLMGFKSKTQASRSIERFYRHMFGIPKHQDIQSSLKQYHRVLGPIQYQAKLQQFFHQYEYPYPTFHLRLKGRVRGESCFIIVKENQLSYIIFVNNDSSEVFPILDNRDHRILLLSYMAKKNLKAIEGLADLANFLPL